MTNKTEPEQWKCGNEFLPYHPDASHADPAYRNGWNDCYRAAQQLFALCAKPNWEPTFDAMVPGQEDLVMQFCMEIAGPKGKPGRLPDPVRLLEMAEALYQVERAHATAEIIEGQA